MKSRERKFPLLSRLEKGCLQRASGQVIPSQIIDIRTKNRYSLF